MLNGNKLPEARVRFSHFFAIFNLLKLAASIAFIALAARNMDFHWSLFAVLLIFVFNNEYLMMRHDKFVEAMCEVERVLMAHHINIHTTYAGVMLLSGEPERAEQILKEIKGKVEEFSERIESRGGQ